MNNDYDKVCLPPVPHVGRLVLRLNLHDPGRHSGEVHRRVSTASVQVKRFNVKRSKNNLVSLFMSSTMLLCQQDLLPFQRRTFLVLFL